MAAAKTDQKSADTVVRLCFVCMGNICRSPTAEGVMAKLVADAGLSDRIEVDSAGTGGWHAGERPDDRAVAEARHRGVELTCRARQFHVGDFYDFDLILAMDHYNLRDINELAPDDELRSKVHLLRGFDPASVPADGRAPSTVDLSVPDPYYGGENGFAEVFDLVEAACRGLLDHVRIHYL